jgi:hypothetical protein
MIIVGIVLVVNHSCVEDFLEQPSDAVINIDSVFADPDRAMQALFQAYGAANSNTLNGGLNFNNANPPYGWANNSMMWGFCDEGYYTRAQSLARVMIDGTWGPDMNKVEYNHSGSAQAMRVALIFIENADKVPYEQTPLWNWDEAFKNQVKSEAKFWLAFLHFEAAKRHGGIPIMSKLPTFTNTGSGLVIDPSGERQSVRATYNFILRLCDEIIPYLPDSYPDAQRGRVTKGAALALKSKVLLFAASPLLNEPPVVSFGDARDSLLTFYPDIDPDRWTKAKNAAAEAIAWAENNGYQLLQDPGYNLTLNYLYASTIPTSLSPLNKEVILDRRHGGSQPSNAYFQQGSAGWLNFNTNQASPNVEFVKKYFRTVNGQDLNMPDSAGFRDFKALMRQMEPRFHAIVHVPGYYYAEVDHVQQRNWGGRDTAQFFYYKTDGTQAVARTRVPSNGWTGPHHGFFFAKKWFTFGQPLNTIPIGFPLFRLPELYLNYAEASNEVTPTDADIITHLNKIRVRGGLPVLQAGQATYDAKFGNKDLMREEIKRERAIELWGEEHRYFDVRRWKMAEVNGGKWYTIQLYENGTGAYTNPAAGDSPAVIAAKESKLSYRFVEDVNAPSFSPRVWRDNMYYYPWPQSEINKGIIVQNPGWKD